MARGFGVVVRPVEPADLHRKPIFAMIGVGGHVGAVRTWPWSRTRSRIARDSRNERGRSLGRGRRGSFRPVRSADGRRGSAARAKACEKSTMPMKSRSRIQGRESSAALARANSCGSMPEGARRRRNRGRGGRAAVRNTEGRQRTGLAADDSITLPAPAAPKRNISLRFNDIHPSRKEARLYQSEG